MVAVQVWVKRSRTVWQSGPRNCLSHLVCLLPSPVMLASNLMVSTKPIESATYLTRDPLSPRPHRYAVTRRSKCIHTKTHLFHSTCGPQLTSEQPLHGYECRHVWQKVFSLLPSCHLWEGYKGCISAGDVADAAAGWNSVLGWALALTSLRIIPHVMEFGVIWSIAHVFSSTLPPK